MHSRVRGVANRMTLTGYQAKNLASILLMGAKHGPFDMLRDIRRYPWLMDLLGVNGLLARLVENREGTYRTAVALVIEEVTRGMVDLLEGMFHRGDRLVIHEDMVPPEILHAMGLQPWMPELLGILLPMLNPRAMERYLDAAENQGVPPDICSLPRATMGVAYRGEFPPARAIVTSNLPCDGGMASYTVMQKITGLPAFRLDVPYDVSSERAHAYFAGELRAMIAWLEEHTPGRMDWDRLRDICGRRNRMAELELEIWDMIRARPAPMAGEAINLSHLWGFNVMPGRPSAVRMFERLADLTRKSLARGKGANPREKHRVLLWNPPTLHYIDLFVWAERAYGASCIIDSMSFNRQPFIDTSSPETMLRGLAHNIMNGPMARHTRGPAANYFTDMFHLYSHFSMDMIWIAGHIGCKNTQALNGLLREDCRARGIPLLIIEYDLCDPRIVPRDGIRDQVDHFMENVMKEKRRA